MSVKVYITPSSVQCTATLNHLERLKIEHETFDITTDSSALDVVKSLGYLQRPVVVIDGDHWGGFRPDKINQILQAA